MRFAMVEMKLFIAKILSKYKFNKCDQTPVIFIIIEQDLILILSLFNSKKKGRNDTFKSTNGPTKKSDNLKNRKKILIDVQVSTLI